MIDLDLIRRDRCAPSVTRRQQPREQERLLSLVQRFGWNATSFQVLEPGFEHFFAGNDACVGYVDTGGAWLGAGAPIARESRLGEVAARFVCEARKHDRRAAFFATEARFLKVPGFESKLIGVQPVWNPEAWQRTLQTSRSLREQLRRARAKGVRIHCVDKAELERSDSPLRASLLALAKQWLATRALAPMGFLVDLHPFVLLAQRRLLVAQSDARIFGFAVLAPVYARNGFLVQHLVRAPGAPNGTMELLVDHAMRMAAAESCSYVTLGLTPLAGDVDVQLRAARALGRGLYDFAGLHAFKAKLLPGEWSPIYLSYPCDGSGYTAIYDSLLAFSRGSLLRFGIASLLQRPRGRWSDVRSQGATFRFSV